MSVFDLRAYFSLAEELGARTDEASRRSAISRAYYAVLAVSWRALPAPERARIARRQVHQLLWTRFAQSSNRACRQVGGAGARLRDLRNAADYREDTSITTRMTELALDEARLMLALVDRHGYQP